MKSRNAVFAVMLAAATMLASVGLVATGGWLISAASLLPPILTLQVAIVAVRFFGVLRGTSRWAERVISHEVALTGTTQRRVQLWKAAAVLGPRGIWRLRGSDALDRLTTDSDVLQDDVTRVRIPLYAAALSAVLLVAYQTMVLPLAGIALAIGFLVSGLVVPALTLRRERSAAADAVIHRDDISRIATIAVLHADELRMVGGGSGLLEQLTDSDRKRVAVESRAAAWTALSGSLNGISAAFAVFGSLLAAVFAYDNATLDGRMIAVLALLPWSASEIIGTFSQVVTARVRVEQAQARVEAILDTAAAMPASATTVEIHAPQRVTVEDLCVAWNDTDVVHDVSFNVERGQRIAIVGPSGSGKSTVAAALLRLVEFRGHIRLDGVDAGLIKDFRTHMTALLQTTHIFHTSLEQNLRLARPEATEAELLEALRNAGLGAWFESLTQGLATVIGDGGRGLSGGEIQRIGIARVLLTKAAFVVLDEPTEHLDAATADAVWHTVESVLADRGVIVITHDVSVAARCDKVMELVDGREQAGGADRL